MIDRIATTLMNRDWIEECSADIPDLATAYALQDAATARVAAQRGGFGGYKIAFNSPALLDKLGLSEPATGRVFADQVYDSGVRLKVSDYTFLMLEPEICARLSDDITPDDDTSPAAVLARVERFYPAFEILDRRNRDGMMHIPTVVAHNVFNAGLVLGGPGVAPQDLDYRQIETTCLDGDHPVASGRGIAPQDPALALSFLAQHYTSRGMTLPKGALLLLGSHAPLYPVEAGHSLTLDLGPLGQVAFST